MSQQNKLINSCEITESITPLPELLAPAGSLEKLKTAIHYGADAIYLGSDDYSLRAHATLDNTGIEEAVAYARRHKVKAYVTVNILAHNRDLAALPDYLNFLKEIQVNGLIISDPGIFSLARQQVPELPIHLSTQANVTNSAAALFWQNQGATRVNLARELSLTEIKAIRKAVSTQLEIFVHGALCISYSGRCSLSLYMTDRNANKGNCAHPCRYRYRLEEEKRPGIHFPVEEDQHGTYIFNSKDLCLLNRLPQLIAAGADSLKLEGRMKSVYYVGSVVRLYRAALDYIEKMLTTEGPACLPTLKLPQTLQDELTKIGSRGYTENFFSGPPEASEMIYDGVKAGQSHGPVGVVRQAGNEPLIDIRNPLNRGETVEYLGQGTQQWQVEIMTITKEDGSLVERANPGNLVTITTQPVLKNWQVHGLLRKKMPAR